MKNIKEIRAAELANKAAAEAKANRQEELESLEQKDAFSAIPDVAAGNIASVVDDNENLRGIEGGKYHTREVGNTVISAETKEELDAIEARMAEGIQGDGMLHKTVYILGMKCDIQGRNEQELEEDYKKAEEAAYSFRKNGMFRTVPAAEVLHNSEYTEHDGKDITVRNRRVLLLTHEARAIAFDSYETILDLSDLGDTSGLKDEVIEKLLTERLEKKFLEEDLAAAEEEANSDYDGDEDPEGPYTLYVITDDGDREDCGEFDTVDEACDEGWDHSEYDGYIGFEVVDANGEIVDDAEF